MLVSSREHFIVRTGRLEHRARGVRQLARYSVAWWASGGLEAGTGRGVVCTAALAVPGKQVVCAQFTGLSV